MSNRKKVRLVAIISLFSIPGLHRFYIGDNAGGILFLSAFFLPKLPLLYGGGNAGILALLFASSYVGFIFTLVDIFKFSKLSDQEFDARYTVGFNFKVKPENLPKLFTILAVILIIIGGVGLFFKERVLCLPEAIVNPCMLLTEGNNILDAKGIQISREVASIIQNFPPYILGLGGIFILGAILKSGNRNA